MAGLGCDHNGRDAGGRSTEWDRAAFGCKVYDYYCNSEGAPYVTQCAAGGKHVNPEFGIIEILREDGTPAEPGELGYMVLTSFFQRTMPLIRYRIGDTARLADADAWRPCGRAMPLIDRIEGRESDCLYSTEAGWVGSAALSSAFYKIPRRVQPAQIQQIGLDQFVMRYVPLGEPLTDQELDTTITALRDRLGSSADIRVEVVSEIPKSAQGKMRLVIGMSSEIPGEADSASDNLVRDRSNS